MNMEPFITKKTIDYLENEVNYQPAHTDFAMLKVEDTERENFQVKLSVEVTSTLSNKTGAAQIMLTKDDQVALIKKLLDNLKH